MFLSMYTVIKFNLQLQMKTEQTEYMDFKNPNNQNI